MHAVFRCIELLCNLSSARLTGIATAASTFQNNIFTILAACYTELTNTFTHKLLHLQCDLVVILSYVYLKTCMQ